MLYYCWVTFIVQFLTFCIAESGVGDVKSLTIGADAVLALDLLIAGSTDGAK